MIKDRKWQKKGRAISGPAYVTHGIVAISGILERKYSGLPE
jgi:hypothetical protein